MMTSCQGRTSQLHKRIAQMNCTKQDDVMSKNGNDEQCFGMLQSNSGAYGVPETVNLRLSPAEPHFPILFSILVQSDRFISFRK